MKTKIILFLSMFSAFASVAGQTPGKYPDKNPLRPVIKNPTEAERMKWDSLEIRLYSSQFRKMPNRNLSVLKSSQTNLLHLDSLIYLDIDKDGIPIYGHKNTYRYDFKGNLLQNISYFREGPLNIWIPILRYEYVYDSRGNEIIFARINWSTTEDKWITETRTEKKYDELGNVIQNISYIKDTATSMLTEYIKEESAFDVNNHITSIFRYDHDKKSGKWINSARSEFAYDNAGNLMTDIYYVWNSQISEWAIWWKSEYKYNPDGKITQFIDYSWVAEINQWAFRNKRDYSYETDGNHVLESVYSYQYDEITDEWNGSYHYIATYDTNGKVILVMDYSWDYVSKDWHNDAKHETAYNDDGKITEKVSYAYWNLSASIKDQYVYDSYGNNLQYFHYVWDTLSGHWTATNKSEYAFNYNYLSGDLILPYPFNQSSNQNMMTGYVYYSFDTVSAGWVALSSEDYYYSEHSTIGINDKNFKDFNIYPNPASDYIVIDPGSLNSVFFEIYNMTGTRLLFKEINGREQLSLSRFKSGQYFYTASSKGNRISGKLIVQP